MNQACCRSTKLVSQLKQLNSYCFNKLPLLLLAFIIVTVCLLLAGLFMVIWGASIFTIELGQIHASSGQQSICVVDTSDYDLVACYEATACNGSYFTLQYHWLNDSSINRVLWQQLVPYSDFNRTTVVPDNHIDCWSADFFDPENADVVVNRYYDHPTTTMVLTILGAVLLLLGLVFGCCLLCLRCCWD